MKEVMSLCLSGVVSLGKRLSVTPAGPDCVAAVGKKGQFPSTSFVTSSGEPLLPFHSLDVCGKQPLLYLPGLVGVS